MPTYIAMLKWTAKGLEDVKQSPARLDAARKTLEHDGFQIKEFYMVIGQYDCIAMLEAPDDASLAKALLTLSSQGTTVSETCRAFTEHEYRQIMAGLP